MTKSPLQDTLADGPFVMVGAGNMGGAMLAGLLQKDVSASSVVVVEPSPSADLISLRDRHGFTLQSSAVGPYNSDAGQSRQGATAPSIVLYAVKPQLLGSVLKATQSLIQPATLVISIAAGWTLSRLEAGLPPDTSVIRTMPNTPAAIGQGVTGAVANGQVSDQQRLAADAILACLGNVVWLGDEVFMDALTAVSGSGPAYVFHLVEALAAAGVQAGLPENSAQHLARQTLIGAAGMLNANPDTSAATLRENVTSPGGTTQAGLEVLMREPNGLSELLSATVEAAATRSRELAKGE
ncbi:MAG: pyrroline-5-carboxylate reductase [Pseudomonadota bacterium]